VLCFRMEEGNVSKGSSSLEDEHSEGSSSGDHSEEDKCLAGLFAVVDVVGDILGPDAFSGVTSRVATVMQPQEQLSEKEVVLTADVFLGEGKDDGVATGNNEEEALSGSGAVTAVEEPKGFMTEEEMFEDLRRYLVANHAKSVAALDRMRSLDCAACERNAKVHSSNHGGQGSISGTASVAIGTDVCVQEDMTLTPKKADVPSSPVETEEMAGSNSCMGDRASRCLSSFSGSGVARSSTIPAYSLGGVNRMKGNEFLEALIKSITPDLDLLTGEYSFVKEYHDSCDEVKEHFWLHVEEGERNLFRLLLVPVPQFSVESGEAEEVMHTLLDLPVFEQEELLQVVAASMAYIEHSQEGKHVVLVDCFRYCCSCLMVCYFL
jgi:hypothetical protein